MPKREGDTIVSEQVFTLEEPASILADESIVMRIEDQGAGPYLNVKTRRLWDEDGKVSVDHWFAFDSEEQIGAFAKAAKRMLKKARKQDSKGES